MKNIIPVNAGGERKERRPKVDREREEFEKWWKDEREYVRSDIELAFVAFQAGRRSRQKQDAELCRDKADDAYDSLHKAVARDCAAKIEQTP